LRSVEEVKSEQVLPRAHVPFFSRCMLRDADAIATLILRSAQRCRDVVQSARCGQEKRNFGAHLRSAGLPTSRTSFMVSSPASTSSLRAGRHEA
jgi:hypothetical protein